jgi:hypothetical protein
MHPKNRDALNARVVKAAEAALAAQGYAASIDVLVGIGWLDPGAVERWRRGQIDYLEQAVQANLSRVSEAMKLFRQWAAAKGLTASQTAYVARRPGRPTLQFSKSGAHSIETLYRTHWVSKALSEKQRERLAEKASRPPDLLVVQPLKSDWTCHRCGRAGDGGLLIMENEGPACLPCVGLGDLEFLPAGDAKLTRRVKANSPRSAVVVRFSRTRGRYERQGLLVEPQVLADCMADIEAERSTQDRSRESRRGRSRGARLDHTRGRISASQRPRDSIGPNPGIEESRSAMDPNDIPF